MAWQNPSNNQVGLQFHSRHLAYTVIVSSDSNHLNSRLSLKITLTYHSKRPNQKTGDVSSHAVDFAQLSQILRLSLCHLCTSLLFPRRDWDGHFILLLWCGVNWDTQESGLSIISAIAMSHCITRAGYSWRAKSPWIRVFGNILETCDRIVTELTCDMMEKWSWRIYSWNCTTLR